MAEPARNLEPEENSQPHLRPVEGTGVYDAPGHESTATKSGLKVHEGGGESTPRSRGHLHDVNAASAGEIENKESAASTGKESATKAEAAEKSLLNKPYNPSDDFLPPSARIANFALKVFGNKKRTAGGVLGIGTVVAIVAGFSLLQGPFQLVHFAKLLAETHLQPNEDFGDDRGSKLMLYAMAGMAERGRLPGSLNKLADIWEDRTIKSTGLRPLYNSSTGRGVGYEIISDKKDPFDAMHEVLDKNPELRPIFDRLAENGGEIRTFLQAQERGQLRGTQRKGSTPEIDKNHFILDLRQIDSSDFRAYKEVRAFKKGIGTAVVAKGIPGALGSRLEITRAGVRFGFFENAKRKLDEKADADFRKKQADDYEKNVLKRFAAAVKTGVKRDARTQTDNDGDPASGQDTTPAGQQASAETAAAIEEVSEAGEAGDDTRELRKTLVKGGVAVGVFCAVKGLGDSADDYKYANQMLPLVRLGFALVGMGNQIMSGDNVHLDEVGVMSDRLYDPETGTSALAATSIRVNYNENTGGPDTMPTEARLNKIGDRPDLFELIDFVSKPPSPLGPACDAINFVGGLPIIRDISNLASGGLEAVADVPLSAFGTSVAELAQEGLAFIAGEAVDTNRRGAPLGSMADAGVKLGASDHAISMGSTDMSTAEVAELRELQNEELWQERQLKPMLARYFDPYDYASLSGHLINNTPGSTTQVASMINPIHSIGASFSGLFSSMMPKADAAAIYDYGISNYGYSAREQADQRFEDPYDNARLVEPDLDRLNSEYGEDCFGMTIVKEGEDIHIKSGKAVNIFKLEKDPEYKKCRKQDNNKDRIEDRTDFLRYRFYLADAQIALSLACYEGDETACQELGFTHAEKTSDTSEVADAKIDMENLRKPSVDIACASGTKDAGVIDGYTGGEKVEIRLCEVTNLPQGSGYGAKNGHATVNSRVSGAVYAMVEAAKQDGVNMSAASSSRTMADQQSLCPCDGVSVARPGYSNHQLGIAIDFGGNGQLMDRSNPMWLWLNSNADKFGYKPYEVEPWHWSPLGS